MRPTTGTNARAETDSALPGLFRSAPCPVHLHRRYCSWILRLKSPASHRCLREARATRHPRSSDRARKLACQSQRKGPSQPGCALGRRQPLRFGNASKDDRSAGRIAVGETLCRLTSKCLCSAALPEATAYLFPLQVGVACPLGTEGVVHCVRQFQDRHSPGSSESKLRERIQHYLQKVVSRRWRS